MGYSRAQGIEFDREMLVRLKSLPGVQSVTLGDFSPLSYSIHTNFIQPESYVPGKNESMEVDSGVAGPEYLRTVRTALLAGRDFTDRDDDSAQSVSIINKALADRYWPGQDAIGKRLQVGRQWTTVVGVAANGKYRRLVYDTAPLVLIPMLQSYNRDWILYVRVAGDPCPMLLLWNEQSTDSILICRSTTRPRSPRTCGWGMPSSASKQPSRVHSGCWLLSSLPSEFMVWLPMPRSNALMKSAFAWRSVQASETFFARSWDEVCTLRVWGWFSV